MAPQLEGKAARSVFDVAQAFPRPSQNRVALEDENDNFLTILK
jgi:hypothetical protein